MRSSDGGERVGRFAFVCQISLATGKMAAATVTWTYGPFWPSFVLLLLWLSPAKATLSHGFNFNTSEGCTAVKAAYMAKGFNSHNVPIKMISGELEFSASLSS